MLISHFTALRLVFLLLFLSSICVVLFPLRNIVLGKDYRTHKCGRLYIQFPFYLRNNNLNHTHYPPGFDLLCTENHETILELPSVPVKFFVNHINYMSQRIEIYDPQNCISSHLMHFSNVSVSSFQFLSSGHSNVSIFRCDLMSCPILQKRYDFDVIDSGLISCTKVKDVMWSADIYISNDGTEVVKLEWSNPDCSHCEAQGQKCKWKNSTKGETECFDYTDNSDILAFSIVGGLLGLGVLLLLVDQLHDIYHSIKKKEEDQVRIEKFLKDYREMKPTRFSYADIKRMTSNFELSLGEGGHGQVFKGMLSPEIPVAVKKLKDTVGDGKDFINEVSIIGKIYHINVVRLLGFCAEEFFNALVYDFFPNGSLQRFLATADNKDVFLGWTKLEQLAIGVARGIEYLHDGCDHRILHFDINPHNVLLDEDFVPKLTDFGLAKLCPKTQSTVSITAAKGTLGYIAPEVFSRGFGNVSYKSDIYSYGMLLLEMVGGKKNTDVLDNESFQVLYPEWIHNLLEDRDVHVSIEDEGDVKIAKKLAIVGLWCIQWNSQDRPCIKTVVQMLEGDGDNLIQPPAPFDMATSSTSSRSSVVPARRQTLELEVIHEIEEE